MVAHPTKPPAGEPRLVDSKLVASASLHIRRPFAQHLTVWPFLVVIYPIWTAIYLGAYDRVLGTPEATFLSLVAVVTAHALTFLATEWSVRAKAFLTCSNANSVDRADTVRVTPTAHAGTGALCALSKDAGEIAFEFQKQTFVYDRETGTFKPRAYPVGRTVGEYRAMRSGLSVAQVESLTRQYGKNEFDIPVPTFLSLMREHVMAPFFVFQVFCVGLWALDEYWYYSLFTLGMLAMFESTVVGQRLKTLQEFRGMAHPPHSVFAKRGGVWTEVMSDELLPGDLVSVPRVAKDEQVVPCDILLLGGATVVNEAMLSGESTPLHKEAIALRAAGDVLDDDASADARHHIVYAGTKVVQATPPPAPGPEESPSPMAATPDNGALGVVLRTGFGTAQGKLVRMMVYSSERVSANNAESFMFIGFLLIFAVLAASYVWVEGQKHGRPPAKLLLDCILIVTSVVPPELPMELSMAVNTSLVALSKLSIFCTEPFRIPLAGKLDILCFDKTGTITSEDLVVEGIAGLGDRAQDWLTLRQPSHTPTPTLLVLAAAHALVKLDEPGDKPEIIGDPLEKATLAAAGYALSSTDHVVKLATETTPLVQLGPKDLEIVRKFAFSSALKRMSTIARVPQGLRVTPNAAPMPGKLFAAVKGAPETIATMLAHVPDLYEETYKSLARNGGRVLALAWKPLDQSITLAQVPHMDRDDVERDLTFAGFLVLSCPLKPDSAAALSELMDAGHRCVMITGDAALTACHVAKQVKIVDRECLILDSVGGEVAWRTLDEDRVAASSARAADLVEQYDLCVTGKALTALEAAGDLAAFTPALPYIYVWARVSPAQKEWVLTGLKAQGFHTLMCGDGTNDVGALKQAHIGVALLDATPDDLQKMADMARLKRVQDMYAKQCELAARFGRPPPPPPPVLKQFEEAKAVVAGRAAPTTVGKDGKKKDKKDGKPKAEETEQERRARKARELQDAQMAKMQETLLSLAEMGEDEAPTLKFGDASVAAPFTSKLGSLTSIANVIKQGRCTLVTTLQMYKILALNCLISAYGMSVLFMDGMKWGDWQMTIQGLLMAVCFFCISRGQPLEKLARARPLPSFFNAYAVVSVLLQFAVHGAAMYSVTTYAKSLMDLDETPLEPDFEFKKEFSPNLLNAGVYLLITSMQVSTFAVNYVGRPFRESIQENAALYRGLMLVGSVAFIAALEILPPLNEWLQLCEFPPGFADRLTATMAADFALVYGIERACKAVLAKSEPRKELRISMEE
ncbi:hypothetical protein GGF31_005162 [Allomyces arbusculus]|nr:hypothetical protein GGF31_005162 [Allomyces arbusculus]